MKDLSITLLSKDELKDFTFRKILDSDPATDYYIFNCGRNGCEFATRTFEISGAEHFVYNYRVNIQGYYKLMTIFIYNFYGENMDMIEEELGDLLPVLKLSEIEKKLNKKIDGDYVELFLYPQFIPGPEMQKKLTQSIYNGNLVEKKIYTKKNNTLFGLTNPYIYYDKESKKIYIHHSSKFDIFDDHYINNSGEVVINRNVISKGQEKGLFIECIPIKFYVNRSLDYLIPTKLFLKPVNAFKDYGSELSRCEDGTYEKKVFLESNFYRYLRHDFLYAIDLLDKIKYCAEFIVDNENINEFLNMDHNYYIIDKVVINFDDKLFRKDLKNILDKCSNLYCKKITICFNKKKLLLEKLLFEKFIEPKYPGWMRFNFEYKLRELKPSNQKNTNQKESHSLDIEIKELIQEIQNVADTLSQDLSNQVNSKLDSILKEYKNKLERAQIITLAGRFSILSSEGSFNPLDNEEDINTLKLNLDIKLLAFKRSLNNRPKLLNILDMLSKLIDYSNGKNINQKPNNKLYSNIANALNIINKLGNAENNEIKTRIMDILNKYRELISKELDSILKKEIKLVLEETNYEEKLSKEVNDMLSELPNISPKCLLLSCLNMLSDTNIEPVFNNRIEYIIIEINQCLSNFGESKEKIIVTIKELITAYINQDIIDNAKIKKITRDLTNILIRLRQNSNAIEEAFAASEFKMSSRK